MKIHIVKNLTETLVNLLDQRIIQVVEHLPMEPAITILEVDSVNLDTFRHKIAECSRYVCGRTGFLILPTDNLPATENLFCFKPVTDYEQIKDFVYVWITQTDLHRLLETESCKYIEHTFGLSATLVEGASIFGRTNLYDIDGNSDQYVDLEQLVNQLPVFSALDNQQLNNILATYVLKVLQ